MSARFNVSMLMLNTALAGAVAAFWVGPWSQRTWQAPTAQASNLEEIAQSVLLDNPVVSQSYPEILERPLLSATRKQPPPPAKVEPDAPPPPPTLQLDQIRLTGIIQSGGVLWVLGEVEGKPRSMKQGDEVGGWKLASVNDRKVSFSKGSENHEIELLQIHTPAPGTTSQVEDLRSPPPPVAKAVEPAPDQAAAPAVARRKDIPGVSFGAPPPRRRASSAAP